MEPLIGSAASGERGVAVIYDGIHIVQTFLLIEPGDIKIVPVTALLTDN